MKLKYIYSVWLLSLTSCSLLGPNYVKPHVNIPQHWNHVQPTASVKLPELLWWKQFHNTELNALIKTALQQNQDIHIAWANLESAKGELWRTRFEWLPQLNILGGYTQMPYFGNPGAFYIFFPKYMINLFQQYRKQKSAQALVQAHHHAIDAVKLTIIAQVASGFFTLLAQENMLHIYQALLKDTSQELYLNRQLFDRGLISEDHLDTLARQVQQFAAKIDITQYNITVSQNALHDLLNQNPGRLLLSTHLKDMDKENIAPGNAPLNILRTRPDILEQEERLKLANEHIGVQTTQLLPSITLNSYLGQGNNVPGSSIRLLEGYGNQRLLDLPVFGDIKIARGQYLAMRAKYIKTIRQALRDIENDLSAHTAYQKQLTQLQTAYAHQQHRCHLTEIRRQYGINNDLDRLHCQIDLAKLELLLTQARLDKLLSVVHLYQNLGAGYRD